MNSVFNRPVLVVDERKCRNNIRLMAEKARFHNLVFRPHFKTHQSIETGEWFRSEGTDTITVSSVSMASFFAGAGWNDITIAFPLNIRELDEINRLTAGISLNILADMPQQIEAAARRIGSPAGFFIEIDTGHHRAGIAPDDYDAIQEILGKSEGSSLMFKGFLTHSGNTYRACGRDEILQIHNKSRQQMASLKQYFAGKYPGIINSAGDTPSCSISCAFEGIDEIRPGNFVYYDLMQFTLGSCSFDQIAAAVVCPVVSVYPGRNETLIYGGAVHFSKESMLTETKTLVFGLAVPFIDGYWGGSEGDDYVVSISQEHGIIKTESTWAKQLKPGDVVAVIPVHSCLTADLLKSSAVVLK